MRSPQKLFKQEDSVPLTCFQKKIGISECTVFNCYGQHLNAFLVPLVYQKESLAALGLWLRNPRGQQMRRVLTFIYKLNKRKAEHRIGVSTDPTIYNLRARETLVSAATDFGSLLQDNPETKRNLQQIERNRGG